MKLRSNLYVRFTSRAIYSEPMTPGLAMFYINPFNLIWRALYLLLRKSLDPSLLTYINSSIDFLRDII